MPKHIALIIGIGEYKFLPKLAYAQRDAELIGEFLVETAGFGTEQGGGICLCTNSSPNYQGYSTRPGRAELRRILRRCFDQKFLHPDDSFWFFFSGHGIRYDDKDYLMPADGDPEEPDETAIELNYVTERLTRSGAGHVVMILDACRSEGQKSSQTDFGRDMPKGVTTIFSCKPKEPAYEIGEPICQSAFTHVLLENFRQQTAGTALTVLQLEKHLQIEVPRLNQQYNKPVQQPHIRCDSAANGGKVLLPHLRVPLTVEQLKGSAYRAEALEDWGQAKQLWLTVLHRSATNTPDHQEAETGWERVVIKSQQRRTATGAKQSKPTPTPQSILQPQPQPPPKPAAPKPAPPKSKQDEDDLSSEKAVDYTKLRDLLKAQDWKAADLETANRMLEAVGRGKNDRIRDMELLNFPCKDLLTIDRLWVKYSQGKFGFSVQKQIYIDCGAKLDGEYPGDKIWEKFCDRVGWRVNGKYIGYSEVAFNTSAAGGHLPALFGRFWTFDRGLWGVSSFASRLVNCSR